MKDVNSEAKGVNRRDFLKAGVAGAVALGFAGLNVPETAAKGRRKAPPKDWKAWAKENFKGVENETLPSFTPDFRRLEEKGIRLDVNQAIKHGFFSTLCTSEAGLSFKEAKELVNIVTDEGEGKILVSTTILFNTFDECFKMLEHAAKAGCSHVLLGFPPSFYPKTEKEVYERGKEMIDTADIGIILYPSPSFNMGRFDDIGFPIDVLADWAKLPNVIACKVIDGPLYKACYERFGKQVLIGSPSHRDLPSLIKDYGQQWMGAGCYEQYQSPEKPLFVKMFNHLLKGEEAEGLAIHKKIMSASGGGGRGPFGSMVGLMHFSNAIVGSYHWPMHKYFQWCTGGNGGYTRQPVMKLTPVLTNEIKSTYKKLEITPSTPDEMFYVSRVYWSK